MYIYSILAYVANAFTGANLLYDASQTAIPFDNVDEELLRQPQLRWQSADIGRFTIFFWSISSIIDIITFCIMWFVFGANSVENKTLFQSGWFVVGVLTQTLIVYMISTKKFLFCKAVQQHL